MCGIAGLISQKRIRENGSRIKKGIVLQTDRGNGLGAGYAAYGIYPEFSDLYAIHLMSADQHSLDRAQKFLEEHFFIHAAGEIPVWKQKITDHPLLWRYFVEPRCHHTEHTLRRSADDYTIEKVMELNRIFEHAFVFSSGKNMGVFKGVGTPQEIYDFYGLDNYEGYCWLAHNRFPTNTPGWWGGAHPFNLLSYSIVHNGEISSYGINRRFLEGFGYYCRMQTDSEVVAYLLDLLIRRHALTIEEASLVLAPPYWIAAERLADDSVRDTMLALKIIYESAMLNGPFAILAACTEGLFSITDNTKLRPMTIGRAGDYTYFASEVSALYEMEQGLRTVTTPRAGQPCIVRLEPEELPVDYLEPDYAAKGA
ncbi:MAG: glutamine amidotransferase family protein [Bacillota bacterium]